MCNTRIRDHQLVARKPDLGSMEYIYDGSEPVSADAIEMFYERFGPYGARRGTIHPAYGMAEATLMITTHPKGEAIVTRDVEGVRVVSVGYPRGDFEIRIVGEGGEVLPAESVGEVVVRGASISPGYFQNEEENHRRFRDGWFHTGDLGLLDPQGRLYITGRIKDLIIVGGRNFYAHDIAARLEELPFVRRGKSHVFSYNIEGREEVIVMTVLDSSMSNAVRNRMGELKDFLTSEQGKWLLGNLGSRMEDFIHDMNPADLDLLKTAVKQYLMREFGLPIRDVFLVPRIPRTTSGKIRRDECEALYREYLESGPAKED
jgi:acyl-CoA synthetase (AMP-forming)/AMP-acid ligase II